VGRYYCPHQKTPNAQNSKNGKIPRPKKKKKTGGIFVCSQNGCHPEVEKVAIISYTLLSKLKIWRFFFHSFGN
jgi:hypothetical protein